MTLKIPGGSVLKQQSETVEINRAGTDVDEQVGRSVAGEEVINHNSSTNFGAGGEVAVWTVSVPAGEKWILQNLTITSSEILLRHNARVVVTTGNVHQFRGYFTGEGNWDFPGFELDEGEFKVYINATGAATFKWNVMYVVKKI